MIWIPDFPVSPKVAINSEYVIDAMSPLATTHVANQNLDDTFRHTAAVLQETINEAKQNSMSLDPKCHPLYWGLMWLALRAHARKVAIHNPICEPTTGKVWVETADKVNSSYVNEFLAIANDHD